MLTKLRLKNLKTWGEQLWDPGIDLAPITLLLGPNSAGKTSLLQLPLLLKQTFESPDRHLDVNLGGESTDLVDLGSFEAVIHQHETRRELGLGLTLDAPPSGFDSGSGIGYADGSGCGFGYGYADGSGHGDPVSPTKISYVATFVVSRGAPVVKRLELSCNERSFAVNRQARGGYLLGGPGYTPRRIGGRLDARRSFQPERSVAFSTEAIAELGPLGAEVQDLSLRLRQAIGRIAYLGPLRERPKRSYLWGGAEPGEVGKKGEYAVHALLASDNAPKRQQKDQEGGRQWLVERVSRWLERLGVADELRLERQGNSRHYELVVVRGGQRANIIDVGFGISQVLPMLLLAHFVPAGTTIIAEQPEIHLHPRAQVGLAELMAEVARSRGVQFLVETHSEHLFRRLQTLTAEEKLRATDCRLYFVDQGQTGAAELCALELDQYGRVSNWPKHFFGDAVGETERQTRKMLERLAKKRSAPPR